MTSTDLAYCQSNLMYFISASLTFFELVVCFLKLWSCYNIWEIPFSPSAFLCVCSMLSRPTQSNLISFSYLHLFLIYLWYHACIMLLRYGFVSFMLLHKWRIKKTNVSLMLSHFSNITGLFWFKVISCAYIFLTSLYL